jgi:hypothetical protein
MADNIKMDLKERGCKDGWIHLAKDRFQWQQTVMKALS